MIQASRRYVPHVALMLALVAANVWVVSSDDFVADDCANPAALFPAADAPFEDDFKTPEERHHLYDANTGHLGHWSEGSVNGEGGIRLHYSILRSFEPRRVYHRPGRALVQGERSLRESIEPLGDGSDPVPLHRIRFEGSARGGRDAVAAYLLVHGVDEPVANPYLKQILSAPEQLVRGREPMTLYLVFARELPERRAQAEEATRRWLAERWENHRAVCSGAPAP